MPYDPRKDGMRETAKGMSIPHVSYRSPVADAAAPTAPARKRRRKQRAVANPPRSIPTVSQDSVAAADAPTSPKRVPRRRRRYARFPWKPVLTVLAVTPAAVATVLGIYHLATLVPAAATSEAAKAPVVYVTATPIPNLAQTATSVLPPGYIESLSQTPGAPNPSPNAPPTVTPAFVQPTPQVTQGGPSFTLGSSKIVYVCNVDPLKERADEICIMNADGSNQRRLTFLEGTDYYPSLSPDGRVVVFSSQRGNGPFNIYGVPAIGGDVWRISNDLCQDMAPEISPDDSRIVFTSTRGSNESCGDQNIWVMNVDGSNPVQLTFDSSNEIDPSWSPDGSMISFTSNRSGTNELFVMNADGSNMRQVTTGISIGGRNDWSPDGSWLTFYAGPGSDKDIFLVPIECAQLVVGCDRSLIRQLTNGGGNQGPSFSPDGQWITFASKRDGDNEIMIMRFDGSEVTALTQNEGLSDWQPRWGW